MSYPSATNKARLDPREYTVGWISALPIEYAAATAMLDEEHEPPAGTANIEMMFTPGRIHGHNVVVACLPAGEIGLASAASVATHLAVRFPNAKIGLMVGIGGGVPSDEKDIRLGDVVVSQPGYGHGGVVQYDKGKRLPNGRFENTSNLDRPPQLLLNALSGVQKNHILDESLFHDYLAKLETKPKFSRQKAGPDRLFRSDYQHTTKDPDCSSCDPQNLVPRPDRPEDELIQFHYGTIASANSLIKDSIERDQVCKDLGGNILCFEMEAAGLMNNFPCLVIRGICDYADSHKNKRWQPYAAATASAYAKELLSVISPKAVVDLAPIKAPWALPFNRNPEFTGRRDILEHLHLCLKRPDQHPYIAIYGLGGSGKSAVVIEFAYQARERNPSCAIFWVSSFTSERFEESYREIARQLQISGVDDPGQDILSAVQRRLSAEDQGQWIMIVDNIDDESVLFLTRTAGRRLYDYLPHSRRGMILFTTRDRKIATGLARDEYHSLGEMMAVEAKDFLHKALKSEPALYSDEFAGKFLEMLTYLPLAIIQALAYIKARHISLRRYVELFMENLQATNRLLEKDFHDPHRAAQSFNAVSLTWRVSFQRIEQDNALAAEYLRFLACIAPQNIPRKIFPPAASNIDQDEAIGVLTAYAFLRERPHEGYYDMHTLIHHVTQDRIKDAGTWKETSRRVGEQLRNLIPYGGHERSKEYAQCLPHGQFVAGTLEIIDEEATIDLLDRIGRCYFSLGDYRNAIFVHQEVFKRRERTNGLKDETTLTTMNELGLALSYEGDYVNALEWHRRASSLRKEVSGAEHPETLISQSNLASTYRSQGRWKEAESLDLQVLETRKRVLGVEHPNTLTSQSNLALTYRSQGRWKEAESLDLQVLETSKQVLGVEHPDTLISQSNLASTYWNQGRWKEAESLEIQVLETSKQVLGVEHPDTLIGQSNLASTYRNQGRWKEAESLDLQVLETSKQVLGVEHPDTLIGQSNLASTYRNQGRLEQAESLEVQVLEMRKRVLGVDHPETLQSMENLASTFNAQGRLGEAIQLMKSCAELSTKVLGAEHYGTTRRLHDLSEWQPSSEGT